MPHGSSGVVTEIAGAGDPLGARLIVKDMAGNGLLIRRIHIA
jgi:hypothetical protein